MFRRLTYLEGFRDALDTLVTYLRTLGGNGRVRVSDLIEALGRALAHVEEEIRSYKAEVSPTSILVEELKRITQKVPHH